MKKLYMIVALVLISVSALAQSGRDLYNKYSDQPGVEAVYISPAMFRMIGRIPDLEMGDDNVNLSPIIRALTGLYILNSENPAINGNLRADAERFIKSGKYELLMEAKDSGETIRMYTVGNDRMIEGFVMLAAEPDEVTFICLDGQMPRKEFEELLARKAAD